MRHNLPKRKPDWPLQLPVTAVGLIGLFSWNESMAMNWIKMRDDLHEDPAVLEMAVRIGVSPCEVVGMCHKFWSWVSRQCNADSVTGVTLVSLNCALGLPGFAEHLCAVGWLEYTAADAERDGRPVIRIPNFDRHLSQGAKRRALTSRRVADRRSEMYAKCNAASVTESATREEKIREEKIRKSKTPLTPHADAGGNGSDDDDFEQFWQQYPKRNGQRVGKKPARAQWLKLAGADRENATASLGHYAATCNGHPKDAVRYLRDRIFDDVTAPETNDNWSF